MKADPAQQSQKPTNTVAPTITLAETGKRDDQGGKPQEKPPNQWWLIGFTGALVVASVLQWYILRRQADLTREYVDVTHTVATAAKDSATAARDAATTASKTYAILSEQTNIAREAAGAARANAQAARNNTDALINSQRAWVDVTLEPWNLIPSETALQQVHITITNHGKTIAFLDSVHTRFHMVTSTEPLPPQPHYDGPNLVTGGAEPLLPSKKVENLPVSVSDQVTNWHAEEMKHERCHLFLYTRIQYRDFAEIPRETQVCYIYRFSQLSGISDGFQRAGGEKYNKYT